MSNEPAHRRIKRIHEQLVQNMTTRSDVEFLLTKLEETNKMLREQQSSVNDAASRWR